ncbi:MAG: AraC family transcriptional regulator [Alphaproteobacteria bacterium]|nr:AraC family transcriptional regulator [Alphaproteobacteria bacterium]
MAEFTVAAGLACGVLDFAVSRGANARALSERSGIDLRDLADQDNRVPVAKYKALMRAAKDLSRDPAFALHFGESVDLSEMSVVGLIGRASQTMLEAFMQLNRYGRLVVEVDLGAPDRFQLAPGDGGLWFVDTRRSPNDFPELTESTMARVTSGCLRMILDSGWTGERPSVMAAHFTHPDPGYRSEYERIFRTQVVFDADRNAILVDATWPTRKLAPQPRYVFGVLSRHADALLEVLDGSTTMRGQVESLLLPILHTGDVGKDAIAGRLGMSGDTLLRRLKAEGTTFEAVLDGLRRKMALHYLNGEKVSVNETAYLVGFSEPAAFSRAFKRWTGVSPRGRLPPRPRSG